MTVKFLEILRILREKRRLGVNYPLSDEKRREMLVTLEELKASLEAQDQHRPNTSPSGRVSLEDHLTIAMREIDPDNGEFTDTKVENASRELLIIASRTN